MSVLYSLQPRDFFLFKHFLAMWEVYPGELLNTGLRTLAYDRGASHIPPLCARLLTVGSTWVWGWNLWCAPLGSVWSNSVLFSDRV